MKKITDNLYLGDMNSAPVDSQLIISCAHEIFETKNINGTHSQVYHENDKKVYFDFLDYPRNGSLDVNVISEAISLIEKNINDKKIYVHCLWGVNRSASIVFMYIVKNKKISSKSFDEAFREFRYIYPNISPNPGWKHFLINNFPYDKLGV